MLKPTVGVKMEWLELENAGVGARNRWMVSKSGGWSENGWAGGKCRKWVPQKANLSNKTTVLVKYI